jgi:hypothetical protein
MYNLVWQSVMCRPGKLLILPMTKNQMLRPTAPTARRPELLRLAAHILDSKTASFAPAGFRDR